MERERQTKERDRVAGAVVRRAREAKGWSPTKLAAAAGYSERQIYRIELGEATFSPRIRVNMEAALGPLEIPGDEAQKPSQDADAPATTD